MFTSTNALSALSSTSNWFTPAAAGTYWWTALYNGDTNNNTASSACQAPNQSVVMAPFQAPAPTRTVTGDLPGPLTVNAGDSVVTADMARRVSSHTSSQSSGTSCWAVILVEHGHDAVGRLPIL